MRLVVCGMAGVFATMMLLGCGSRSTTGPARYHSMRGVAITVAEPRTRAAVTSPVRVSGKVPGTWSFEASFPIELLDAKHRRIATGHAAVRNWTRNKPVAFTATIPFKRPSTGSGFLVLRNDNPSGEADQADSVEIPITFK